MSSDIWNIEKFVWEILLWSNNFSKKLKIIELDDASTPDDLAHALELSKDSEKKWICVDLTNLPQYLKDTITNIREIHDRSEYPVYPNLKNAVSLHMHLAKMIDFQALETIKFMDATNAVRVYLPVLRDAWETYVAATDNKGSEVLVVSPEIWLQYKESKLTIKRVTWNLVMKSATYINMSTLQTAWGIIAPKYQTWELSDYAKMMIQ